MFSTIHLDDLGGVEAICHQGHRVRRQLLITPMLSCLLLIVLPRVRIAGGYGKGAPGGVHIFLLTKGDAYLHRLRMNACDEFRRLHRHQSILLLIWAVVTEEERCMRGVK